MVVGSGRLIKTGLAGIAGMNAAAVEKAYTFVVNKANDIAQRMGGNEVETRLSGGSKDMHVHIVGPWYDQMALLLRRADPQTFQSHIQTTYLEVRIR